MDIKRYPKKFALHVVRAKIYCKLNFLLYS